MWILLLAVVAIVLIIAFGPWFRSYRTVIVQSVAGVVLGILPLLDQITGFLEGLNWENYVGSKWAPVIFIGVSIIGIIMRFRSKGAVGQK